MSFSEKVIHSPLRTRVHIVLVRPEFGGNIGSAARAVMNMGVAGDFVIVGGLDRIDDECRKFAKHAWPRVEKAVHLPDLTTALARWVKPLSLALTARSGSAHRPHPIEAEEAVGKALEKLDSDDRSDVVLVFGPESDGLDNAEVSLCDQVVTIPTSSDYRSLNLAQSVLLLCYEANRWLRRAEQAPAEHFGRKGQRDRLIQHFLELAETSGFVLPGDPFKMRPRLEGILAQLPPHIEEVGTLHGFLDQVIRGFKKGAPDIRGRYLRKLEEK